MWKLALIETVDRRVKAPPSTAPGPGEWREVSAERDAYRKIAVEGRFAPGACVLVQAVTELGPGFWVVQAFRSDTGFIVLVNRGFIPNAAEDALPAPARDHGGRDASARRVAPSAPAGRLRITGLLRMSEPRGGFLRRNDPASGRWYSRDVAAIAQSLHLGVVAPYFIDADGAAEPRGGPVGGLTVIRFPNSHLIYALTWFGLAALSLGAGGVVVRDMQRRRAGAREAA